MTKPRILIVEDDRDLREALVITLELAKFRVHEAADGHAPVSGTADDADDGLRPD